MNKNAEFRANYNAITSITEFETVTCTRNFHLSYLCVHRTNSTKSVNRPAASKDHILWLYYLITCFGFTTDYTLLVVLIDQILQVLLFYHILLVVLFYNILQTVLLDHKFLVVLFDQMPQVLLLDHIDLAVVVITCFWMYYFITYDRLYYWITYFGCIIDYVLQVVLFDHILQVGLFDYILMVVLLIAYSCLIHVSNPINSLPELV